MSLIADVGGHPQLDKPLVGTLRRAYAFDGGSNRRCVLVTDDGHAYQLNTFEGSEEYNWDHLEARSLGYLSRFESKIVEVEYSHREDSVFGPSLWGVTVRSMED